MAVGGAPTEAEIQTQWRNVIDILDKTQVYADSLAGTGQELDALVQSLEGDFTPDEVSVWASQMRAGLSGLTDSGFVYQALSPIMFEYGKRLRTDGALGSGFETVERIKDAVFKRFVDAPLTVESRDLTFDTSQTTTGTGNGGLERLTTDADGFDIEAVHVEKKVFVCRRDQNSGAKVNAEEFEFIGQARSPDNIEFHEGGSGATQAALIRNRNGGPGQNGSLLKNSSFSTYDTAQTNDFNSWELVSGTVPTQDVVNYYLPFPGSSIDASLKASATFRLKQSLADMRVTRLDPNKPYFLRVMVNGQTGAAVGGEVVLHLGSQSVSFTVLSIAATGWTELIIPMDANTWFQNFNEDDFNIEIEATALSSGYLLFDDMIFTAMTQIDGSFWTLRQNDATPVAWLVDDEIAYTDSQADITKGKIQFYLFRAGLGYLPHSGSPSFTDP